jgi:hypothetical protein
MSERIPTFEWNSEEDGKKEYHLFDAALQANLATRQCRFVLDNNAILINTPIHPGPEPTNAVDLREWRKLYQSFWVEQKKFYGSFDTAIGILQSMLIYPSKARNDIDIAIRQRPVDINEAEWTPDKQFQAAMEKLQGSYAPRNETDTTTLRRQLQELSDEMEGGFHEYANQFIRIYTELIKSEVPNIVGETELREWVKAGIKNDQVLNHLAATICRPDVEIQPTFEQIFAHVRGYLTFLGHDKDPYRIASSSHGKISANKVRILTPERKGFTPDKSHEKKEIRCTRCWHKGHRWAMCRATKCSVCGNPFPTDAKFCPKWESHTEPGTKWIHPSFYKQQDGQKSAVPGNPAATDEDPQMIAARQALKQARKFLKATVKEAKKKKP